MSYWDWRHAIESAIPWWLPFVVAVAAWLVIEWFGRNRS
jgi:hypothetical protein